MHKLPKCYQRPRSHLFSLCNVPFFGIKGYWDSICVDIAISLPSASLLLTPHRAQNHSLRAVRQASRGLGHSLHHPLTFQCAHSCRSYLRFSCTTSFESSPTFLPLSTISLCASSDNSNTHFLPSRLGGASVGPPPPVPQVLGILPFLQGPTPKPHVLGKKLRIPRLGRSPHPGFSLLPLEHACVLRC